MTFLLTTHFIQLCEILEKKSNIKNIQMKTTILDNISRHTYRIAEGISKIKGGICVLRNLEYPDEILTMTEKTIQTL